MLGHLAVQRFPSRFEAETICRLYPIGTRTTHDEDLSFLVVMLRLYEQVAESVSGNLRAHLPRWKGEERLAGLLILASEASKDAAAELATLDSERSAKLRQIGEHLLKLQAEEPPE